MGKQKKRDPWVKLRCSYPQSEKVNGVSIGAEMLYVRLIASCDDEDRYYGDPALIAVYLLGHRYASGTVTKRDVHEWVTELVRIGLVERYEAGGKGYLHLIKLQRYYRSDKRPDIRFPPPEVESGQARIETVTEPVRTRNDFGPLDVDVDVDVEEEKRRKDVSSDVEKPPTSKPTPAKAKARILWTKGTGWKHITPEDEQGWAEAYPAVDIRGELLRMTEWLKANPKRAVKSNWRRFIANWFSRTQDRGGNIRGSPPTQRTTAEMLAEQQGAVA